MFPCIFPGTVGRTTIRPWCWTECFISNNYYHLCVGQCLAALRATTLLHSGPHRELVLMTFQSSFSPVCCIDGVMVRRARYLCDVCDVVNVYTGQGRNKVIQWWGRNIITVRHYHKSPTFCYKNISIFLSQDHEIINQLNQRVSENMRIC